MKYSLSMTEAEFLGLARVAESVLLAIAGTQLRTARGSEAPPVETPPAAPTAVVSEAPKAAVVTEADLKLVEQGCVLFNDLVHKWLVNFGLEGTEQPDRILALRDVASGPEATAVLWYVSSVGGLTHAVDKVIGPATSPIPLTSEGEERWRCTVRDVAANITQISSLYFHDLCALYEHRDIYKEKGL